jgi:peptidoglycan/LPS O-acetylase OafA/YrhL
LNSDASPTRPPAAGEATPAREHGPYRLGYRPDIEGLRAVAILLVVAAHAGVPWLAGGFVGVDVFFVLSGYLITGLLVQEMRATGGVRLLDFYARRLRRLLPALLVMVVGTAGAAAVLLAPLEQPAQARAASAAALWLSNLHFVFSQLDYFGPAAGSNLFLHTWSLGVEEQFYLAWPLLVLFLAGSWRWQAVRQDWSRLLRGMLATVGICLVLSVFLTYTRPEQGFYLMPSRAWQFALGAVTVLAVAPADVAAQRRGWLHRLCSAGQGRALGWIGLALVVGAGLLLDTQDAYPGMWAVLPSLGTALVLAAGTLAPAGGAAGLLAAAPMRRLGQVSYGWYLWHWPVLLLGATVSERGQPVHVAWLVALSLALAFVSYHLVEAPVRHSRFIARRPLAAVTAALVLMVGVATLGARWGAAAADWALRPDQQRYAAVRGDLPAVYGVAGCDEWYRAARVQVCGFGDAGAARTALVIGDSVTMQWFPAVMETFGKQGWRVLVITKSACPMVDEPYFYPRIGRVYTECSAWRDAALTAVATLRPDVVLTGSTTTYPFTDGEWFEGSRRVLDRLAPAAGRVFIVRATPMLPFDGPGCLARQAWRRPWLPRAPVCSAPAQAESATDSYAAVSRAAAGYANVRMLDLNAVVCPDGVCAAQRDGRIVYRDSMHVTAGYITTVAQEFAKRLGVPAQASARRD